MLHTLRGTGVTATVKADGAELCSLKNEQGQELLWQAGPAWPRHAPILFPIVGRLKNDQLRHQGHAYPMSQHGFARDRTFSWIERTANSCTLALSDDADTRLHFPFAFRLVVTFAVTDAQLDVIFGITNTGQDLLPVSLGAHPAFNWPLLPGLPKEAYGISFAHDENEPVGRLRGGLLLSEREPTPIKDSFLHLSESLFTNDAIILTHPNSTAVRFAADRGPAIDVSWQGFRELGIWSKPGGAPFLCIEPWHGFASPTDFDGEFYDKPGLMKIASGTTELLKYRIRIG